MFRKLLVLAALAAFAVSPTQAATGVAYQGNANQLIPVASSTPLPVTLTSGGVSSVPVNLVGGTITASMSAFVTGAGVATAAVVDGSGYTYVNVATGSLNTTPSFVTPTGVASSGLLDSTGRVNANVTTGTVAVSNGLAVENGLISANYAAVATDALTLITTYSSGTAIPFWVTVQNVGTVNLHKQLSGAVVSDSAGYLAPGDSQTWYVATNTPSFGVHAVTTGAVGAVAVEITK